MPTNHAILSASSSHRWLECPPSAKLCAELPDTSSEYAQEGTDAHALCEHRLKALLGRETTDPTENLTYYNEEMELCAVEYATYAYEQVEKANVACNDPIVLIEQKLDFSRWVPEGFGTGDCVIVADGTRHHFQGRTSPLGERGSRPDSAACCKWQGRFQSR